MFPLLRGQKKEAIMTDCAIWLQEYLKGGALPCETVRDAAYAAGFSKRELQVARAELGVIPGSVTTWSIPEDRP